MMSEAAVQQRIRLAASNRGILLFRNNSGAMMDDTGRLVRYGLGNDSKKVNSITKSADLIGVMPHLIGPQDVGRVVGLFISVETKKEGWVYTATPREVAQLNWHDIINGKGGLSQFAAGVEDIPWL